MLFRSVSTFVITLESDGKDVPQNPDTPSPSEPEEPDENGYYFHDTFEGSTDSWESHGSSEVTLSGRTPYKDKEALLVQNREKAWNGTQKALNSLTFKPGNEYSFSVCAAYLDGDASQDFSLTLQYTDSNGDVKYSRVASATAIKGNYVQLANTNYKIPEGASDLVLYVETASGTDNFYIDEAIGAVAGTVIEGPAEVKLVIGDVNSDGVIDCLDITSAKNGFINGFKNNVAAIAADVNQDGTVDAADIKQIKQFVFGIISEF